MSKTPARHLPEAVDLDPVVATAFQRALSHSFADRPEAIRLLSEAIELADGATAEQPTLRAYGSLARAQLCFAQRDAEGMRREAERSLEGLPSTWRRERTYALHLLGRAAEVRGAPDEARSWYEQGLEETAKDDAAGIRSHFLGRLAAIEAGAGRSEQASAYCLRARALHQRSGNRIREEQALFQHGVVLLECGSFLEAVAVLQEAADLCREVDLGALLPWRLAALADAQRMAGLTAEPLANAEEALSLMHDTDDRDRHAVVWSVLADVRLADGDVDGALEAGEARLALARQLDESEHLVDAHAKLALACLRAGRVEQAEAHASQALDHARRSATPWTMGAAVVTAGEVALEAGRFEDAVRQLEQGLDCLAPHGARRRAEVHGLLASAHERRGDLEASVRALKERVDLLEVLSASESRIRLQHMRTVRHVEKAEAAVAEADRRVARALVQAQEDERRHIARELHDDLSQRMAIHVIELEALAEELAAAAPHASEQAQSLAMGVRETAASLHRVSRRLHPALLERIGLIAAARSFMSELEQYHGLTVEFEASGFEAMLGQDAQLCLFRVIQEALQNVVRHSEARRAHVSLSHRDAVVELIVEDHGRGFDVATAGDEGIGLVGMRERVRQVGGRFEMQAAPGRGTRITVRIPVADTESEAVPTAS